MSRRPSWAALLLTAMVASGCSEPIATAEHKDPGDTARKHIESFAGFEALGEDAGGPGESAAMKYVASYFETLGLETFTQSVPLVLMTPTSTFVQVSAKAGTVFAASGNGVAYVLWAGQQQEDVAARGGVAFVGYGIVSPEYDRDDYKDVDVKGKIVLMLEGSPHTADHDDLGELGEAYYGRQLYKFAEAARHGAIAAFIIHGEFEPWEDVVQQASGTIIDIAADVTSATKCAVQGWLTLDATERLFHAAGLEYDKLREQAREVAFRPTVLADVAVDIKLGNSIARVDSHAVIAVQRGRTPEYIVAAARWNQLPFHPGTPGSADHARALPILPAAPSVEIVRTPAATTLQMTTARERSRAAAVSRGDGSGAAVLMETARRLVLQHPKPERTVVFMVATAVKPGIVALQHYARHPMFPLKQTIAHIFLDQASPTGAREAIGKIGTDADDALAQMIRTSAIDQGRLVVLDQNQERRFYYKYSQAAFENVPSLYLTTPPQSIPRVQSGAPPESEPTADAGSQVDPDLDAVLLKNLITRVVEATNWRPAALAPANGMVSVR
jgi:Zn-dependent M28 family amino/carboxypeptidase